jgi:hypothetical protein
MVMSYLQQSSSHRRGSEPLRSRCRHPAVVLVGVVAIRLVLYSWPSHPRPRPRFSFLCCTLAFTPWPSPSSRLSLSPCHFRARLSLLCCWVCWAVVASPSLRRRLSLSPRPHLRVAAPPCLGRYPLVPAFLPRRPSLVGPPAVLSPPPPCRVAAPCLCIAAPVCMSPSPCLRRHPSSSPPSLHRHVSPCVRRLVCASPPPRRRRHDSCLRRRRPPPIALALRRVAPCWRWRWRRPALALVSASPSSPPPLVGAPPPGVCVVVSAPPCLCRGVGSVLGRRVCVGASGPWSGLCQGVASASSRRRPVSASLHRHPPSSVPPPGVCVGASDLRRGFRSALGRRVRWGVESALGRWSALGHRVCVGASGLRQGGGSASGRRVYVGASGMHCRVGQHRRVGAPVASPHVCIGVLRCRVCVAASAPRLVAMPHVCIGASPRPPRHRPWPPPL